jgi:hypothetical protein
MSQAMCKEHSKQVGNEQNPAWVGVLKVKMWLEPSKCIRVMEDRGLGAETKFLTLYLSF